MSVFVVRIFECVEWLWSLYEFFALHFSSLSPSITHFSLVLPSCLTAFLPFIPFIYDNSSSSSITHSMCVRVECSKIAVWTSKKKKNEWMLLVITTYRRMKSNAFLWNLLCVFLVFSFFIWNTSYFEWIKNEYQATNFNFSFVFFVFIKEFGIFYVHCSLLDYT